jgi:hypothetical protein
LSSKVNNPDGGGKHEVEAMVGGASKWVFEWDMFTEGSKVFIAAGDGRPVLPLGVDDLDGAGKCNVEAAIEGAGHLPISCSYFMNEPKMPALYPSLS